MRTKPATRSTAAVSAVLASLFTLTACGNAPGNDASTEESATRAAPASGEAVFKAVIFGSGPIAAKLSMWSPAARAQALSVPVPVQIAKLESALTKMRAEGWSPEAIAHTEKTLTLLRKGGALPQVDEATRVKQEDFVIAQLAKTDPTFFKRFGADMQSGNPVRVEAAFNEARKLLHAMAPHASAAARRGGDGDSGPLVVYIVVAIAIFVFWVAAPTSEPDTRLASDHLVGQLADELHAK